MPNNITVQNNFLGGFKTEFTGLNFPENACTSVDNCVFSLIGDVLRREGINFEDNFTTHQINRAEVAISTYKWANVGGDGQTQMLVMQVGGTLYFFDITTATAADPLSTQLLASTISLSNFQAGVTSPNAVECQFSDGNGYLFVYNTLCNPFYITYNPTGQVMTGAAITVQIRDFNGCAEPGVGVSTRPGTLTAEHEYNLTNQGWTIGTPWTGVSNTNFTLNAGNVTLNIVSQNNTSSVTNGDIIQLTGAIDVSGNIGGFTATGVVNSYITPFTSITIDITSFPSNQAGGTVLGANGVTLSLPNVGYINTWFTDIGNYPSNADVWWQYKNSSDVFDPATQIGTVTVANASAPMGHWILNAFDQNRSAVSTVTGITEIITGARPRTGTFYSGRVWYAGVDAAFQATGDAVYTTWTENIYFSQVVTTGTQGGPSVNFGQCFQVNDPTDEDLFDILPTDGGVLTIQGTGAIYKLFPVVNGILVFAANGIWFITGSQGIGFSATDYTVTKISNVQVVSGTSFINVLGWPVFWNEEGIYNVTPGKGIGGLTVENLALGTILSYYNNIPLISKQYARGDYNPISFVLQWAFRSTPETDVTSRYQYDTILSLNTANRAFYLYSLPTAASYTTGVTPYIHDIKYVAPPGGGSFDDPVFKYVTSSFTGTTYNFTFSEENDSTTYFDFFSFDNVGVNYTSTFTAGYQLHGNAARRWHPEYVYVFSRQNTATAYFINGIFDFGKQSTIQMCTNALTMTGPWSNGMIFRRHRIRGEGIAFQLQISSVPGVPFDIMGWAIYEDIHAGV
jgi:hypothetical protein